MTDQSTGSQSQPGANPERETDACALWRGWRRRCPACGSGPMLTGYLALRERCAVCGEELSGHAGTRRVAGLVTLTALAALLLPIAGLVHLAWAPAPLVLAAGIGIGGGAIAIWLLPRAKGTLVALRWSVAGRGGRGAVARERAAEAVPGE